MRQWRAFTLEGLLLAGVFGIGALTFAGLGAGVGHSRRHRGIRDVAGRESNGAAVAQSSVASARSGLALGGESWVSASAGGHGAGRPRGSHGASNSAAGDRPRQSSWPGRPGCSGQPRSRTSRSVPRRRRAELIDELLPSNATGHSPVNCRARMTSKSVVFTAVSSAGRRRSGSCQVRLPRLGLMDATVPFDDRRAAHGPIHAFAAADRDSGQADRRPAPATPRPGWTDRPQRQSTR
jgi:hypothetical protein